MDEPLTQAELMAEADILATHFYEPRGRGRKFARRRRGE